VAILAIQQGITGASCSHDHPLLLVSEVYLSDPSLVHHCGVTPEH